MLNKKVWNDQTMATETIISEFNYGTYQEIEMSNGSVAFTRKSDSRFIDNETGAEWRLING